MKSLKADVSSVWPFVRRRANARIVSFQSLYAGQFTLSTQLTNPKFCVSRLHRRSTTVSSETKPLVYLILRSILEQTNRRLLAKRCSITWYSNLLPALHISFSERRSYLTQYLFRQYAKKMFFFSVFVFVFVLFSACLFVCWCP